MKNLKIYDQGNLKKILSLSLVSFVLMSFSGCSSIIKEKDDSTSLQTAKPDFPKTTQVPYDIGKHDAIVQINYKYSNDKIILTHQTIPDSYELYDYEIAANTHNVYREAVYKNVVPVIVKGTYNEETGSYDFEQFGEADPNYVDDFLWDDEEFEDEIPAKKL